jgi:acyl-CoA thioesterase
VTQARATATVEGREVLTVNAALGTGHLSSSTTPVTMPKVRGPEDSHALERPFDVDGSIFQHVECRLAVPSGERKGDRTSGAMGSGLWSRIPGHLEPSAATLAIFGDFVSGGVSQLLGQATMGRSLDNTIRVAQLEATEWVLCGDSAVGRDRIQSAPNLRRVHAESAQQHRRRIWWLESEDLGQHLLGRDLELPTVGLDASSSTFFAAGVMRRRSFARRL